MFISIYEVFSLEAQKGYADITRKWNYNPHLTSQ